MMRRRIKQVLIGLAAGTWLYGTLVFAGMVGDGVCRAGPPTYEARSGAAKAAAIIMWPMLPIIHLAQEAATGDSDVMPFCKRYFD